MKLKPLPPVINLMAGTAGHIDHGKTELVKMFTGCDTDTLREEKERGMSINLGFAPCPIAPGKRIGLVDVPGHEDFIRNMVAGATGIDIVLLIVAADDGIMPQTVEHFNITDLLGVKRGIVVITKVDLVPPERVEEVKEQLRTFLKGTYMDGAPMIPFSAVTAEGIGDLRAVLDRTVEETTRRPIEGVFRLPVERSFSAEGFGTIMTGIAARGKLSLRDQVEILPIGQKGTIRKLQVFGQDWNEGYAGQCLAVNAGGVDSRLVKRGAVLATAGYFSPVDSVHARVRIHRNLAGPFKNRAAVRFHTGTTETIGTAILLEQDALGPGEEGLVQIVLNEPIIVEAGDRYILRLENPPVTVGGGRVIGHSSGRLRRKRPWVVEKVLEEEASFESDARRAAYVIRNAGKDGIERKAVSVGATLTPAQTDEVLKGLAAAGATVMLPGDRLVVAAEHFDAYCRDLQERLGQLHQQEPLRLGFTSVEIKKETQASRGELTAAALARLTAAGAVVLENDRYRLASFRVQLDDELSRIAADIEGVYLEAAFQTPRPETLPALVKGKDADIQKMLQKLIEGGTLVKAGPQVLFHRTHVEKARADLVAYLKEHRELDSFDYKNLIGSSRKYAIPLLDYFDAAGVTMRGHQNKRYLKG